MSYANHHLDQERIVLETHGPWVSFLPGFAAKRSDVLRRVPIPKRFLSTMEQQIARLRVAGGSL